MRRHARSSTWPRASSLPRRQLEGRGMISNYKLLVSAIPWPVSFVGTVSKDGVPNLAPFSYFQIVDHDPVTLVIGFSARPGRPKDTQKNLEETGECVINILSSHFNTMDSALENVDLEVLRPVVQLGGISYGRVRETFELPRPALSTELKNEAKGLKRFL